MKGNRLSCWVGVVGLVVVSLNQAVRAASPPINGVVSFYTGSYTMDGPLATATAFTSFTNVSITGEQGPYTNASLSTPVSYSPFTFNPPAASVIPLWSFTTNGVIYSFDAT